MSDFKPIETQEAFDKAVQDRLNREREKFSDYDQLKSRNTELESEVAALQTAAEDIKKTIDERDQTISELSAKNAGYETANLRTRIAVQNGLPLDLADRLVGDDEATLKADAERLAGFIKGADPVPPLGSKDTPMENKDGDEDLKQMLKNLNERGE